MRGREFKYSRRWPQDGFNLLTTTAALIVGAGVAAAGSVAGGIQSADQARRSKHAQQDATRDALAQAAADKVAAGKAAFREASAKNKAATAFARQRTYFGPVQLQAPGLRLNQ